MIAYRRNFILKNILLLFALSFAGHSFAQPLITSINVRTNVDNLSWQAYSEGGVFCEIYCDTNAVSLTFTTSPNMEYWVETKLAYCPAYLNLSECDWIRISPFVTAIGSSMEFSHGLPHPQLVDSAAFDRILYRVGERPKNLLLAHGLDLNK